LSWCQSGHWQQSLPRCSCEAGEAFDLLAGAGDAPLQYGIFNPICIWQLAKLKLLEIHIEQMHWLVCEFGDYLIGDKEKSFIPLKLGELAGRSHYWHK
jgi:hypothetical protein